MKYVISSANECREGADHDPVPKDFKVIGVIVNGITIYDFFTEFAGRFGVTPDQYGFSQIGDTWDWTSVDGLVCIETRLNGEQVKVVFSQRKALDSAWVTVSKYKMTRGFFDFEETK